MSTNSLSRALLNYDEGDIKSVHYGDILIKYPAILNIKNDKIPYITGGKLEKYKSSLLENGDLIFADAAEDETVGKAVEVNGLTEENLVAGLHTIVARPKDKKAEFFLGYYINSNTYHRQLLRLIQGSKVSSISKGNLQKTLVFFPKDFEEQQKIGAFFKKIDETITLHQRKLDTLKEQKKTYLKLLFPSKGQTKPALRFQGFEDDWEEVKLGEVLSVSKLKNKENEYSKLNVLSVSREQGTVNQIEYQGRSFASDDVSGYKIVNVGQMIYTKSPLKGAPYGIFQTVTINGIVSPLYAVYNSSGRALASFVSLILKEDAIATHYLSPLVTKGAKNTINVTDEGALEGKVKIPTLPEQQAIGTFFQTLDREISQVEDKLASLKELKKTLLRKLFV